MSRHRTRAQARADHPTARTQGGGTAMNELAGYLVLTDTGGIWRDDWDGEIHHGLDEARADLAEAKEALGPEGARLVRLTWVDDAPEPNA